MNTWLYDNFGTIVIALLLAGVVIFIIRNMILDKKQGKTSCGGNCSSCGMCRPSDKGETHRA